MLHEALMLEIYRQALNASALPTARPRSTESANSSERCPSHDSNSSENGGRDSNNRDTVMAGVPAALNSTFPAVPQSLPAQPPSMEAYLHMVAAAAQQYGFPLGAAAAAAAGPRLPLPLPTEAAAPFKLPPQASPTASSNNSEALDFRTNLFGRAESAEPPASEEEEEYDDGGEANNNPLDLSVGTRKRSAHMEQAPDSTIGQIQVKKIFKTESPPHSVPSSTTAPPPPAPLLPAVNPYLAAVAAANIFRTGQFPDWNGKTDLVVDPLEKISDIVKGPRKEKSIRAPGMSAASPNAGNANSGAGSSSTSNANSTASAPVNEGVTKARHNIWQSHWQNKGVASSVFRCVWCKQSFPTLEALTTHMKDSKHCGVNVPPFSNLPTTNAVNDRHHHHHHQPPPPPIQAGGGGSPHGHNLRKQSGNTGPSAAAKNAFQYRGDPPTPLPRKLVRGQNVWLGKGVEQAMQILKCMRCGESFRSLGEMTKHMQETQHYTNILSQEQTISMKSSAASAAAGGSAGGDTKDGQTGLSSEESRTLSAVLTCKVCDKAFNSLGELSNHMAKNNHYAEPLMQSLGGGAAGNRKRPAPKKREKSLPVRKLLELKGGAQHADVVNDAGSVMEAKLQRTRISMDGTGLGPGAGDKSDAALFAERMRQYITGVKSPEEMAKAKTKSPDVMLAEPKNGTTTAAAAATGKSSTNSVLSAIEQMFTTSFDTPPRHASLPATSPSNSSTKNTSPVASSILKRLGIDETVDYNKPLIDTSDPYYQHYRAYTSSERSGSECSAETHVEPRKLDAAPPTPDKLQQDEPMPMVLKTRRESEREFKIKLEPPCELSELETKTAGESIKMEIKTELEEFPESVGAEPATKSPRTNADKSEALNGGDYTNNNNNNNNNNNERSGTPSKSTGSPRVQPPRSPTDSHRSGTPKSPASSIKSYDGGDKKYPSDSLNALSSMFDSLGSGSASAAGANAANRTPKLPAESPENLSTSNSLAALRQFCVKKEKTA